MPIGSILLGLALLFGVGLFITRPFWMPERAPAGPMSRREALEAQKAVLLDEIRALEFDHETGKLPEEVFQPRREHLVRETALLLREIDQLGPAGDGEVPPVAQTAVSVDETVRAEIEAAIVQLRLAQAEQPVPVKAVPAPAGNSDGHMPAAGRFCSQCGNSREAGDKFCAYCGHKF